MEQTLSRTLERLCLALSAVPEETLLVESMKQGAVLKELKAAMPRSIRVDGVDYLTTPEARKKEAEVIDFAKAGSIRLRRTRKGQAVPVKEGEVLIPEADKLPFDRLHEWVQKAKAEEFSLLLHAEKPRLYADKARRGEPLVWLEDVAGLSTGQSRPRLSWRVKAVAGKAIRRVARLAERVQSILEQEPERGIDPREVERVHSRGIGY